MRGGDLVGVSYDDQQVTDALGMLLALNELGSRQGIGIADVIETNIDGSKSRGIYVTPGGTIWHSAHMDIGSAVLSPLQLEKRRRLMSRFGELAYAGDWFSNEMTEVMGGVDSYQSEVNGTVNLALYKGNIILMGRNAG